MLYLITIIFHISQEQIWDLSKATPEAYSFLNDLQHDHRVNAFSTLHKADYDTSAIPDPTTSMWKEWSEEPNAAEEFHQKLIQSKKNMRVLGSALAKGVDYCIWYYYHMYKPSENYKALKSLMKDLKREVDKNSDECAICDDGGGV